LQGGHLEKQASGERKKSIRETKRRDAKKHNDETEGGSNRIVESLRERIIYSSGVPVGRQKSCALDDVVIRRIFDRKIVVVPSIFLWIGPRRKPLRPRVTESRRILLLSRDESCFSLVAHETHAHTSHHACVHNESRECQRQTSMACVGGWVF